MMLGVMAMSVTKVTTSTTSITVYTLYSLYLVRIVSVVCTVFRVIDRVVPRVWRDEETVRLETEGTRGTYHFSVPRSFECLFR